jgi:hypothetical protein
LIPVIVDAGDFAANPVAQTKANQTPAGPTANPAHKMARLNEALTERVAVVLGLGAIWLCRVISFSFSSENTSRR